MCVCVCVWQGSTWVCVRVVSEYITSSCRPGVVMTLAGWCHHPPLTPWDPSYTLLSPPSMLSSLSSHSLVLLRFLHTLCFPRPLLTPWHSLALLHTLCLMLVTLKKVYLCMRESICDTICSSLILYSSFSVFPPRPRQYNLHLFS